MFEKLGGKNQLTLYILPFIFLFFIFSHFSFLAYFSFLVLEFLLCLLSCVGGANELIPNDKTLLHKLGHSFTGLDWKSFSNL
jgi:hypothetical protein